MAPPPWPQPQPWGQPYPWAPPVDPYGNVGGTGGVGGAGGTGVIGGVGGTVVIGGANGTVIMGGDGGVGGIGGAASYPWALPNNTGDGGGGGGSDSGGVVPNPGTNPNTTITPGGGGGGWPRPYPGVPSATPVPSSFFSMTSQPIGAYVDFSISYFGSQPYANVEYVPLLPYPSVLRVFAPSGFDTKNWYFLTVTSVQTPQLGVAQILFYEGDPTWLTQGNVQFGDGRFFGMMHLNEIGDRYCVYLGRPT